jgi:phage gp46-like protein
MIGTDAVLQKDETTGFYDFTIDENGDINTEEFFDTAIMYSLFGERRALENEIVDPIRRRGWIGNLETYENGSKLWLLQQARITIDTINKIRYEAQSALKWLVSDGYAVSIDEPVVTINNNKLILEITIRRSKDKVIRRFYKLWENTGAA